MTTFHSQLSPEAISRRNRKTYFTSINDDKENLVIEIGTDFISIITYQINGWIRENVYSYDGKSWIEEEIYNGKWDN